MAKSAWGIELGTSSVKAVKLSDDRGSTTLEAISIIDLADYGLGAGTPAEQAMKAALNQLRNNYGIKRDDQVFVSISGQNTIGRIISLPPVGKEQIRETIENEARSQIPIKLDEAVWDYQVIEDVDDDDEIKVNLYAAKREAVDEVVDICDSAGIACTGIQVAPLGLYNYVKYEFDDDVSDSCVAIDIGADNTDVVIIDGQKTFVRVVPVAGNDITTALRRRFKLSADDAEKLKKRAAKSKDAAAVFEAMKVPLKEMVGEIYRAVGFYKNQHEHANITQLVMMGNGAKLLNIKKFFEQQLQYQCHKLDSPARIGLSRSVDPSEIQSNIHSLAVAIGLGLQGIEAPGINYINLIPSEVLEGREKEKLKAPFFIGGALALVGGLIALLIGITASGGIDGEIAQAQGTAKTAASQKSDFAKAINFDAGAEKELSIRNITEGIVGSVKWTEKNEDDEKVAYNQPLTIAGTYMPGLIIRKVNEGIAAYNEANPKDTVYLVDSAGVGDMPSKFNGWSSNFVMETNSGSKRDGGVWVSPDGEDEESKGYYNLDRTYRYSIYLAKEARSTSEQERLRSKLEKAFKSPNKLKRVASAKDSGEDKSLIQGPIEAGIREYLEESGQLKGIPSNAKLTFDVSLDSILPPEISELKEAKDLAEKAAISPRSSAKMGRGETTLKFTVVRIDIVVKLTGAQKPKPVEEEE
ncbi:type IV pilus assembly protein PilM [Planctomycetota bacterium]|nr:type IV pilus assembly protein PilM [Planctomycetota bacterium]